MLPTSKCNAILMTTSHFGLAAGPAISSWTQSTSQTSREQSERKDQTETDVAGGDIILGISGRSSDDRGQLGRALQPIERDDS